MTPYVVRTRGAGRATVWLRGVFVGRLTRLPNGWQAWDEVGEFVGWGARRRDAARVLYAHRRGLPAGARASSRLPARR